MFDRFNGIKIYLYDDDHNPPHFHAVSAEYSVQVSIYPLELMNGYMPVVKLKKVIKWAETRQAALLEEFERLNPHLRR